jgi:hypothetical protein
MRLLRNSVHGVLVLAAIAVALAPKAVFAAGDHRVPIDGTFTVGTVLPSAVDYCASDGTPVEFRDGTPIEFRGIGNISKLGPLFLTVKKCAALVGGVQTFVGIFTMTAGNGDTLIGTYAGTRVGSPENGGGQFQGTFTFTGGTGRFRHTTSGVLSWTAVTRPFPPTVYGVAFYLVEGTMLSREKDD